MSGSASPNFSGHMALIIRWYVCVFLLLVMFLGVGEQFGLSFTWIGGMFMLAPILLYAGVGILCRTSNVSEYYVAGRRISGLYNGMAVAADWMSAASFLSLAGTLYFDGYQGLAFVIGWTGGYVLVALCLAPYLRKFGQFTIADFLSARYGGALPRLIGASATIMASFIYVVAQIYGVGLITSRFIGVEFEIGVFVGLTGILVCSFLGGMRAVTWTQVAQCAILIVAYLIPVVLLAEKQTNVPVPQVVYGEVLQQIGGKEEVIFNDPREQQVRELYRARQNEVRSHLEHLPGSLETMRDDAQDKLNILKATNAPAEQIFAAEKKLRALPISAEHAEREWKAELQKLDIKVAPPLPHAKPFPGNEDESAKRKLNFLALIICLMVGTASLPHILMRFYTTTTVADSRNSVFWALLFISMLYFTAPAYAVFAKWEVYSNLVGAHIANLPSWVGTWSRLGLIRIEDINHDGVLQLAELTLNPDVIVLAMPEIAGLPYVVSGLVAAGGLAAALSTADGLLLAIASALSHDIYYKTMDPQASTQRRLVISKSMLLVVSVSAAYAASLRPEHILFLVGLAFSIAASAFFPALIGGLFWQRANRWGAIASMLSGVTVCLYYCGLTHPALGGSMSKAWFGIEPISSGVFGLAAGFAMLVIVSLITPPPPARVRQLMWDWRAPSEPWQRAAWAAADSDNGTHH